MKLGMKVMSLEGTTSLSLCPKCENLLLLLLYGARGGVVVKALRYKPEGRGFDSRWFHWIFSVT